MHQEFNGSRRGRFWTAPALVLIAYVAACNVTYWLPVLAPPIDGTPVPGGIADTRPMFGKTRAADGAAIGDFLLATCGCGDWRILIQDADGRQAQCAVRFFAAGAYVSEGPIAFYGEEGALRVAGTVDQTSGLATGDVDVDIFRRGFDAQRGEAHTDEIESCLLCHIGEDPIYPQPDSHPPYVEGVTDCFDCHTVVID